MMKKRTVRIISCVIAGILVVAMLVSMLASSLTFAAAAEDADSLRDKLSTLEDEKAAVKERIAELTRDVYKRQVLESMKNMTVLEGAVALKSALAEGQLAALEALAEEIAAQIQ